MSQKVFGSNVSDKRVVDTVQDTLTVHSDGSVSFRASVGKGSGRAVQIPGDQFDDFVRLVTETASRRTSLAATATSTDD